MCELRPLVTCVLDSFFSVENATDQTEGNEWEAAASRHGDQCGPTFSDSRVSLYTAANMAGREQNKNIMAMVKLKKSNAFNLKILRTIIRVQ
jgi:hypothetical protein